MIRKYSKLNTFKSIMSINEKIQINVMRLQITVPQQCQVSTLHFFPEQPTLRTIYMENWSRFQMTLVSSAKIGEFYPCYTKFNCIIKCFLQYVRCYKSYFQTFMPLFDSICFSQIDTEIPNQNCIKCGKYVVAFRVSVLLLGGLSLALCLGRH